MNNSAMISVSEAGENFFKGIVMEHTGAKMTAAAIATLLEHGAEGQQEFEAQTFKAVLAAEGHAKGEGQKMENRIRTALSRATDGAATIRKRTDTGKRGGQLVGYSVEAAAKRENDVCPIAEAAKGIKKLEGLSYDQVAAVLTELDSDTLDLIRDLINGNTGE